MVHKINNIQAKPKLYWLDIFLAKPFKVCTDGLFAFLYGQFICFSGFWLWNFKSKKKRRKIREIFCCSYTNEKDFKYNRKIILIKQPSFLPFM